MSFVYIAVMALVFAADRAVKCWAAGPLIDQYGGSMPLIEGVFHLTYAENRGAAFSILQGKTWLLIAVTAIISLVGLYVLFFSRRKLPIFPSLAIAAALGGALGNLYDRVVLGYVIDMLDFCLINFAVFNVADSFVNVGVVLLGIWMLFFEEKDRAKIRWRWGAPRAQTEVPANPANEDEQHGDDQTDCR